MIFLFYISGIIAILSTICVILHHNPMYALLCLITSFLSISCVFFALGAFFAGVIEIIVYAGAIMTLFVFVVMMLNTEDIVISHMKQWKCRFLNFPSCFGVVLLSGTLFLILIYTIFYTKNYFIDVSTLVIDVHQISCRLFGSYMLMLEVVSFILLGALIAVLHISQEYQFSTKVVEDQLKKYKK